MKKILVPCDFSVAAQHAYQFALEIAAANSGQVSVLHVIGIHNLYGNGMAGQPYATVDPTVALSEIKRDAEKEFEKMRKSSAHIDSATTLIIRTGPLAQTILETVKDQGTDLVIMATAGAHGLKEFFVGSNTEKIVRASSVPVFTLHKMVHVSNVRNIILPTMLGLAENELIERVKMLQQFFDAVVHVLFINNYPASLISDAEVQSGLEEYARLYNLQKYTLNVRRGADIEDAIISFAYKIPHSILAMSTHGYKGLSHLLKGSVAEDLVNHATEPVWTYASQQT